MLKQWRLKVHQTPLLAIFTSLIVLVVAWQLINFWQFSRWQQALLEKVSVIELKELKEQKQTKNINNQIKALSFVQVDLPSLPSASPGSSLGSPSSNSSPTAEQQSNKSHEQHAITSQVSTSHANTTQATQNKPVAYAKRDEDIIKVSSHAESKVSAMYQQLISDNTLDIEIAWPNNTLERQNTFSFLYQCLGMKFGVLNWPKSNQPKVTLAKASYQNSSNFSKMKSDNSNQASDWLRIAQGQLASQERHWLKQYNLSGTPVRLFPKVIDWQLASLLTQQLNNVPLTSFRARYKYANNHLMLTNIRLNGNMLSKNWTLITSSCST